MRSSEQQEPVMRSSEQQEPVMRSPEQRGAGEDRHDRSQQEAARRAWSPGVEQGS